MMTVHILSPVGVLFSPAYILGSVVCLTPLCCKCGPPVFDFIMELLCFYLEIWKNQKTVLPTTAAFLLELTDCLSHCLWLPAMTKDHLSHFCALSPPVYSWATIFSSFVSNILAAFLTSVSSPWFVRKGCLHPWFSPAHTFKLPVCEDPFRCSRLITLDHAAEDRMWVFSSLAIGWF